MVVKEIPELSNEQYLALVLSRGRIFNDPQWLKQYGSALKTYGVYNNDQLCAAFFVYVQKKGPFTFLRTPPFTPSNGLVMDIQSSNPSKVLSESKRITKAIADFFNEQKISLVSCVLPTWHNDTQPFTWNKFKTSVHYTYHADLHLDEATLEQNMSAEHRNLMKKALKDGITCELTGDYTEVEKMVMKTFNRKNKELDQSRLKSILYDFAKPENSFAFIAKNQGKTIAAAFCLYDKHSSYYLLGGYDPQEKHGGSGILCIHNAMLHSKKMEKQVFDFEGSMLPEVEKFFRGFGPQLTPYYGFHKAWLPLELVLKFYKRNIF